MDGIALGENEILLSPVIFGCAAIGGTRWGGSNDALAIAAIRAGIDEGITAIDTAPVYGFGRSERVVGEAIRGRRHKVVVATKCGQVWDRKEGTYGTTTVDDEGNTYEVYLSMRPESVVAECEQSLRRMCIETIDLYQVHMPDHVTAVEDTMAALVRLRERGMIRAIGVSNFPTDLLDRAHAATPLQCDQSRYSVLDRRIERDILPWCRARDVPVIVYSTMERGLLTGKTTMDRVFRPTDVRSRERWFQPENRRKVVAALDAIRPVADGHGVSVGQVVTRWVLDQPGISAALVGARDPEQARENARVMRFTLSDEEREFVGSTFAGVPSPV